MEQEGARRSVRKSLIQEIVLSTGDGVTEEDHVDVPYSGTKPIAPSSGITRSTSISQSFADQANDLRRSTLLDEQYVHELRQRQPGLLAFFMSWTGLLVQGGLFAIYVMLDAGKAMFFTAAIRRTDVATASIVISQSAAQLLLALCMALTLDGLPGIREAMNPTMIMKFALVSALFAVAQSFNVLSYAYLSGGTVKILGQVRLLQTAALSSAILGRRYLLVQWAVMASVMLAAGNFFLAGLDRKEMVSTAEGLKGITSKFMACNEELQSLSQKEFAPELAPKCNVSDLQERTVSGEDSSLIVGVCFVCVYLFLSDLGSIISEKFLKDGSKTNFYVQKATIEVIGLPVSIILSFLTPLLQMSVASSKKEREKAEDAMWWNNGKGLFIDWGFVVFVALLFSTAHSWLSGLIVKKLSSLTKLIAKCMSLAVVFFVGDCWLLRERAVAPAECVAAAMVIIGTYLFVSVKPETEKAAKLPPLVEEPSPAVGGRSEATSSGVEMSVRSQNTPNATTDHAWPVFVGPNAR